jgi:phosphoribosylformylglycinamidine (FGAM) synthase-like amidotransferase family enzyme
MLKNTALKSAASASAAASAASAAAAANGASIIDETTKKAIQNQDEITWCSGGSYGDNHRKRLRIIKNSTNRINKTIKRFYSVSNNRTKTQTKSRRHH